MHGVPIFLLDSESEMACLRLHTPPFLLLVTHLTNIPCTRPPQQLQDGEDLTFREFMVWEEENPWDSVKALWVQGQKGEWPSVGTKHRTRRVNI